MPRFQFRLEASLQLAEQDLEIAQRKFAQEVQCWQACVRATEIQQERYSDALEGQRVAGKFQPHELGNWQLFAAEQRKRLFTCETERIHQESIMDKARQLLLEAHRDKEKFLRLKEKQATAFRLAELQKEQKGLDEIGQVIHWHRRKFLNISIK